MVADALFKVDSYFDFLKSISNYKEYSKLDDTILHRISYLASSIEKGKIDFEGDGDSKVISSEIIQAGKLVERIKNRELYVLILEQTITEDMDYLYGNIKPEDICIDSIKPDDLIISFYSVDYGNKSKNPFNSIYFYKDENKKESFTIKIQNSSLSVPKVFRQKFFRVFSRNTSINRETVIKGLDVFIKKKCNNHNFLSPKTNQESESGFNSSEYLNKKRGI